MPFRTLSPRKTLIAATLIVSGAVAGGTAVIATSASADTPSAGSTSSRGNETALTGDTLTKVKDAVLVKYPGATFNRVETDSDGAYEAHITTTAGENLTVELDKDYAITGTE